MPRANIFTPSPNQTQPPGETVVGAWMSSDGNYAFVEFRSADEATCAIKAFCQHNLKILNQPVKIGRPKQYPQYAQIAEVLQDTQKEQEAQAPQV